MKIRDARAADEAGWRALWDGYTTFYRVDLPEAVTAETWRRILDPASPLTARLAEAADGDLAGFAISFLHPGTFVTAPVCYLEDLFVSPSHRRQGVGRLLVQDLVDRAKAEGWVRLYWHTETDNPARKLYDQFVAVDDYVRYRMVFGDGGPGAA
ncbi:MAG: GNAT family N-acetyltransferase [Bauldia sp.]|nr:GNAT family N-acetyltransferase [Bauldia sp.]